MHRCIAQDTRMRATNSSHLSRDVPNGLGSIILDDKIARAITHDFIRCFVCKRKRATRSRRPATCILLLLYSFNVVLASMQLNAAIPSQFRFESSSRASEIAGYTSLSAESSSCLNNANAVEKDVCLTLSARQV